METRSKVKTMHLEMPWAVLSSISRLCEKHGRFTGPTYEDVLQDLEKRYGVKYSMRWIEDAVSFLKKGGYVNTQRGLLKDGRITLLTTKKGEKVAFTLIKLDEEKAVVHNGWEEIVYDPSPNNSGSQGNWAEIILPIVAGVILNVLVLYLKVRRLNPS
jgi:hypothetical protein